MFTKLRRVWPGLAILLGVFGGGSLCLYGIVWGGLWSGLSDVGDAPPAERQQRLIEHIAHATWLVLIGIAVGVALVVVGVVGAVRRGRQRDAASGSGAIDPTATLAAARLRRPRDRVMPR